MLDSELVNITDLSVKRPARTGPGGDVASQATIHTKLRAIHQQRDRLLRAPDGREITIRAVFWLDPTDDDGDPLDVVPGDFLEYSDRFGTLIQEREVVRVAPWFCGSVVDNIEVEIGSG